MDRRTARYEVVKGSGPDTSFIELWDRALAPGGLAFEAVLDADGGVTVFGHGVAVSIGELDAFLAEAKAYLG